jgi:hypothetical protein
LMGQYGNVCSVDHLLYPLNKTLQSKTFPV